MDQENNKSGRARSGALAAALPGSLASAPMVTHARYRIGDKVRHKILGFRGVVYDIDPAFANSEEWYESIPVALRPDRDQPFYHLLADNGEQSYVAYVSQQNLTADDGEEPIDHPAIPLMFELQPDGDYRMDAHRWH